MRYTALALLFASAAFAAPTDGISATPAALSFSYVTGGSLPAEQKVQIKRTISGSALDFVVTVPPTAPWLIVTPLSGKTGTPIGMRVNPSSLLAGVHTAVVTVTAAGITNPATVTVSFSVKNAPPTAAVSPASIGLTFQTDGAAPADQTISVSSTGEPISFTAAATGGTWLSINTTAGITVAGNPVVVTASINTAGLVPATYSGRVTFTFASASNKTLSVPITLTVTAGRGVISSLWPTSAPIGSTDTTVTMRGSHFFNTSVVNAGATVLKATWVSTGVMIATIPQSLLATQGALSITVTNAPQPASVAATFTVTPPGPVISSVVNAASFSPYASTTSIAPGEMISIFGSGLGPGTLVAATPSGGVYPTTAGVGSPATIVEFELSTGVWTAAPIIFASANQINAVAPLAMTPGSTLNMRVTYNSLVSSSFSFEAVAAEPGIFTMNSSGVGQGAIMVLNATTGVYSVNGASNAAPKGSTVLIYMTGGGVFSSAVTDGTVISDSGTPPALQNAVAVTIGGDGATVASAHAVPGSIAGLVAISVVVPETVKASKELPVVIDIAGRASPATATISVK